MGKNGPFTSVFLMSISSEFALISRAVEAIVSFALEEKPPRALHLFYIKKFQASFEMKS